VCFFSLLSSGRSFEGHLACIPFNIRYSNERRTFNEFSTSSYTRGTFVHHRGFRAWIGIHFGGQTSDGLPFNSVDKMLRPSSTLSAISLLLLGSLSGKALAGQVLTTSGFSTCLASADITVQKLDITYDNDAKTVKFDVAGTSAKSMNVTAVMNVTAYGKQVYQNSFNPCDSDTFVSELCPGKFGTYWLQKCHATGLS
jgi:hypothetical protein